MEYLILNSYIKFKKDTKKNCKEVVKAMRPLYIILFVILFVSAFCAIAFLFVNVKYAYMIALIAMLIEFISVIVISITVKRENVEKSKESIEILDKQYEEIKSWLKDMLYIEKNQIKQLCQRCRIKIKQNNEKNIKLKKFIDKVVNLFLIPIYVSILSLFLGLGGNISDHIYIVIEIGIIGMVMYIGIFGVIELSTPFIDNTYIKMDEMVRDIQGMLDRKFPISENDIKPI